MANNNKLEIAVGVNVTGAPQVDALGVSLHSTAAAATGLGDKSGKAAGGISQANASAQGFTATSGKLRDGLDSVSVQLDRAKTEMLALVGVSAGLQGVKDLAALADGYKNLEARIKLTTGEGAAFKDALDGVFAVAKRTNSAVEETGVLFTKLAEAGKTMGISQQQALKLTETINQSIQLSGASAEASKASIVQLVQGLQSGVLRGDEFNSVMEQSPRLAKVLADGLGVGTGELRKMAEQGQLTSSTVIKALQGQSDAVAAEFGKLPATVGRAMQNLTTEFTKYIGESDKAHGYTEKLAGGINLLSGHLSTVATAMLAAGQTLAAMKILGMAQDWLAASVAVKAHAEATALSTAATERDTMAKLRNSSAGIANAAAMRDLGKELVATSGRYGDSQKAMADLGKELAATSAGHAKLRDSLGPVKTALGEGVAQASLWSRATGAAGAAVSAAFGLAGTAAKGFMALIGGLPGLLAIVLINSKEMGTWLGEFVAKHTAAGKQLQANETALAAINEVAKKKAEERQTAQMALNVASDKAIAMQVKAREEAEKNIPVIEKEVKAVEAQAVAAIASVKLSGDEVAIRKVTAEQGALVAAAKDKEAKATEAVVAAITAQIAAMQAQIAAQGEATPQQTKELKDLGDLLVLKANEANLARASAEAAEVEAKARVGLSDAYQDNAKRVKQYTQEVDNARAKLDVLKQSGTASLQELNAAQLELNEAIGKMKAAQSDVIKGMEQEASVAKATATTIETLATGRAKHLETMAKQALAHGDVAKAMDLERQAATASIEADRAKIKSIEDEVAASTKVIEAKHATADATTDDGKALLAELKIQEESNKAKIAGVQVIEDHIKSEKDNSEAIKEAASATKELQAASDSLKPSTDSDTQSKLDGAQASVDSAKARYEDAKAAGDEKGAAAALVDVRKAELEQAKIIADVKKNEAQAAREVATAKKAEAEAAIETAKAIEAEISSSEEVTEGMKKMASEAKVTAIAKAGAAKQALAHADAADVEAKSAEKNVATAERALKSAEKSVVDLQKATDKAAQSAAGMMQAFDPLKAITERVDKLIAALSGAGDQSQALSQAIDFAEQGAATLGDQNLSRLRSAIADAQSRMLAFSESAKSALTSVQDELDQLNSNFDDIEVRRYNERKKALEDQRDKARTSGNAEAARDYDLALAKLEDLYKNYKIPEAMRRESEALNKAKEEAKKAGEDRTATGVDPEANVVNDARTSSDNKRRIIEAAYYQGQGHPAPAPAPTAPAIATAARQPDAPASASQVQQARGVNLTVNVATGVNMSNRADVEVLARAIMPAIDSLQRKGLASR